MILPSAQSASDAIAGKPGAWLSVVGHTLLRAVLIFIGLLMTGIFAPFASVIASGVIELFVLAWTAA